MAKYVFFYHGSSQPESPEQMILIMQAWTNWFAEMGLVAIDIGHPVGQSTTVNSDGSVTDNGGSNPASGYSLLEGNSLEEVIAIAKACPILASGGSIEIAQAMEMKQPS